MAVLLEDILERLNKVERQLNITANHTIVKGKSGRDQSMQAKGKARFFLLVDLREFYSDLWSGG